MQSTNNKFKAPKFKPERKYEFISPKFTKLNTKDKIPLFNIPKNSITEKSKYEEECQIPKFEFNKKANFKFIAPNNLDNLKDIKQQEEINSKTPESIEDKITEEFLNFDNSSKTFKIPKTKDEHNKTTSKSIYTNNTIKTKLLEKITFKNLFNNKNMDK